MFFRVVGESFARNPSRKLLMAAALVLGMAVATATLTVVLDVGDRLAREFRSLGANLLVTPQSDTLPLEIGGVDYRPVDEGAYLPESELGKLRTIFWRLNIVGFSPFLEVPIEFSASARASAVFRATLIGTWFEHDVPIPDGAAFTTGVRITHPWWRVDGRWPAGAASECVVGLTLAQRLGVKAGDSLTLRAGSADVSLQVTGLLSTGGPEDEAVVAPLAVAQSLAGRPGQFRRLLVSALTTPEDAFARRDPASMTPADYDRWYCTPYISAIAHQIREVLPGVEARAIRRVAESEGHILTRVSGLMWLVTLAALLAATLAVGAASATTVLERSSEVGLMKALGAPGWTISLFFLAEQILIAFVGGIVGFGFGVLLARVLGESVFGIPPTLRLILLPVVLVLAALVALLGSLLPLRRAARLQPAPILRGE
ncbi:MAG: ABC transporter permease [Acidobacteria bacterium]|nr:ABC transporter permease [Acidobacteriota bacterium]MBI3664490.1 ABC transporter permease [Acidobacteriota bacterium]